MHEKGLGVLFLGRNTVRREIGRDLGACRGIGCFVTGIEKLHKEKLGQVWVHEEKSGVLLLGLKNYMKRKLCALLIGFENQNYGLLIWC